MKPCRSPYCECEVGKCTHPGFFDARGDMTNYELMQKLTKAQELLSDVYSWASKREEMDDFNTFSRNPEVERLMSVADSCIIDAMDALEWDNE